MHVSSRTGQQNSIHGVEKSINVGDACTTCEHQREGVRDFADAPETVFPDVLDIQDVVYRMGATNNAHYWLTHFLSSLPIAFASGRTPAVIRFHGCHRPPIGFESRRSR